MWKELKAFLMRGNVVDLAVGVIIGGAFGAIVNALVNNIINPIIGVLLPTGDLASAGIVLRAASADGATPAAVLGWGALIAAIINFIIIGTVLFFIIRGMNKMMPPPPPPPPAGPRLEEQMLAELKKLNSK